MECRGGRSKPEKQRQVEKSPQTPPDHTPAEVRAKKEEKEEAGESPTLTAIRWWM